MRRLLIVLPLLAALAAPAASTASPDTQLSIMMDDDQLIYRGDTAREFAMQRMKSLGVDYVRVTVLWRVVAHKMKKAKRRKADSPKAYPKVNWDRYDALVRSGQRNGIGVYLDVTGPGPKWAMGKAPKSQKKYRDTYKPDAREFFKFVKAVGTRYNGTYSDENEDGSKLPRVAFWAIYNEPNQPGWLTPQWKGNTPYAPIMYRDLWYYGRAALDLTGHKNDIVLIGETAPLGGKHASDVSPIYPKRFIREFFCMKGAGSRCSTLKRIEPFNYTAWAHHPYTKKAAPTARDSNRDSITMANIGELPALLKQATVKKSGLAALNLAALTEYGYETNPPDRYSGISPAKQAAYINEGDYLAYKQRNIISQTQFQLRDVPPVKKAKGKAKYFTYQSGLLYANGKPKPAQAAYKLPLVVTASSGSSTSFWGQLRFLATGVRTSVQMQFKAAGAPDFANVGDPIAVTNLNGFFEGTIGQGGPGVWRAVWTNPYNPAQVNVSREIETS